MFARIRSRLLAGGGGLALTLAMAGVVAGATVITTLVSAPTTPTGTAADTTATFEDLDGNGVDDDCQTDVTANPSAAASAQAAVDENGDGTISVTEAAHSDRTGGANCNHGGYVSSVAQDEDTADETTDETTCETTPTVEDPAPAEVVDPADLLPNAHGKAVSSVAQLPVVGGKNCNHGGAVSEAAKKDQEAARAARDARKAAAAAARDAKLHGKGHAHQGD
jgi:hypothetical protein